MRIEKYKGENFPENFLKPIYQAQVDCWGDEPFFEHRICSTCHKIFSLHYGQGYCNECNGNLEIYYKEEEFIPQISQYLKKKVEIILCHEDNQVLGFGVMTHTNIQDVMQNEFATRPKQYDFSLPNKEILLLHQIYVHQKLRGTHFSKGILDGTYQLFSSLDLPIFQETHVDSKYFQISLSHGFETLGNDEYGYVAQINETRNLYQKRMMGLCQSQVCKEKTQVMKEVDFWKEKSPSKSGSRYYNF